MANANALSDKEPAVRANLRTILDVVSTAATVVAAATLIWMVFGPGALRPAERVVPVPSEPLSLVGAPVLGSATAAVVMLEFSDFQCPFCGQFVKDTWPRIKTVYIDTGRAQFAFRHLPLPIHSNALLAAETAACAAAQQQFWPMHDRLFAAAGKLERSDLAVYSRDLGLDGTKLAGCLGGDGARRVQQDMEQAKTLALSSTPVFLIGVRQVDGLVKIKHVVLGARSFEDFKKAIDGA